MALSAASKSSLLALKLPDSGQVRDDVAKYLERTSLAVQDLAHRIDYSTVALRKFLSGRYGITGADDLAIRKALIDFMEAHPLGAQEQLKGRVYETANVRLLRRYFNEALENGEAYYVEGNPGTQKSFVLQYLVADLNRRELSKNGHGRRAYYIYCPLDISRTQLMKEIAQACGSVAAGDVRRIVHNLRFDLRDRKVLLVFDEAQHLSVECLETIRELHDLPPRFGLLFAGSHQLEVLFTTRALELEQWNSRFSAGKRLPGLSEAEAAEIVRGELGTEARAAVIEQLVKDSRVKALGSRGEHEYISARRLFKSLEKLKLPVEGDRE